MDAQDAIDIGRDAIRTCLMIGGPILLVSLVVGLLLGIVQAMTQVQDQTVSFVPKALTVMLMIGLGLPWLSDRLIDFSRSVLSEPLLMAGISERSGNWQAPASSVNKTASAPTSFLPASWSREKLTIPNLVKPTELIPADRVAERRSPFVLPSHRYSPTDVQQQKIAVPDLQMPRAARSPETSEESASPFVLPHAPVFGDPGDDLEG